MFVPTPDDGKDASVNSVRTRDLDLRNLGSLVGSPMDCEGAPSDQARNPSQTKRDIATWTCVLLEVNGMCVVFGCQVAGGHGLELNDFWLYTSYIEDSS